MRQVNRTLTPGRTCGCTVGNLVEGQSSAAPSSTSDSSSPSSRFWVTLRFTRTGYIGTYTEKTAANRALLIALTSPYTVVLAQGEAP